MLDTGHTGSRTGEALVLVVDDDSMIRELACAALEKAGFKVAESDNGRAGLEAFKRLQPDILLLDVMMPELDGFALCRAIRELPVGGETPILMMTGLEDFKAIDEAYEAGATDFIAKPIHWKILCHRVRYMLRSSKAVQDLRLSEARLSHAHRIARMGAWELDVVHGRFYCSKEIYGIFGIDPAGFDASYEAFLRIIHPFDRELVASAIENARAGKEKLSVDHLIVLPSGEERYCHTEGKIVPSPKGQSDRLVGTIQDITERKRIEEQIRSLAYFDSVTGLPNRLYFREYLESAISFAARYQKKAAVLFLDLDRFKEINDSLGHTMGDELLKGIAERLKKCVRGYDVVCHGNEPADEKHTISRLGGDEFTIILENIRDAGNIIAVTQRILAAVAEPMVLGSVEVGVTASIGVSVFPEDGADSDTLLKNADAAMYHAKKEGRNNAQFFTHSLNDAAFERLRLERQLRKALANDEFVLYFQPQVDADREEVIGLEALIRWQSPERGFVAPVYFIPFAEETGQIMLIDEWVIASACRQIRKWMDGGIRPPRVAINLSGRHFLKKSLVETVRRCLQESGVDGSQIELELTEGVVMRNVEESIAALSELRTLGVTISIDDFGTGYSSLSYLKRFPIDVLKIDRSFVYEVDRDEDNAKITSTIISMARSLRMEVIAEGVETREQVAFLKNSGCAKMQGYYFSHPLPADEVTQMIAGGGRRRDQGS